MTKEEYKLAVKNKYITGTIQISLPYTHEQLSLFGGNVDYEYNQLKREMLELANEFYNIHKEEQGEQRA